MALLTSTISASKKYPTRLVIPTRIEYINPMKLIILIISILSLASCQPKTENSTTINQSIKSPIWSVQVLKGSDQELVFESDLSGVAINIPIENMPWTCQALSGVQDGYLGSIIQCEVNGASFVLPGMCFMPDFATTIIITTQEGEYLQLRAQCRAS